MQLTGGSNLCNNGAGELTIPLHLSDKCPSEALSGLGTSEGKGKKGHSCLPGYLPRLTPITLGLVLSPFT